MIKIRVILLTLFVFLFQACWEKQEIDVVGPEMPRYELSGQLRYLSDSLGVDEMIVDLVHLEVYQGEMLGPMSTMTDSGGYYSFPELYRGRYNLQVSKDGLVLFNQDVGMINFADREYIIEISRYIHLLTRELSLRTGETVRGLAEYSGSPLALTYYDGLEYFTTGKSNPIDPEPKKYWMHSGLANLGSGEYVSIRRQVDTTETGSVGAPWYYLSHYNADTKLLSPGEEVLFSGENVTNTFDQTQYWAMGSNYSGQKYLYQKDASGNRLALIPLATNQSGIFSLIETDTAFWAVDTANSIIWTSVLRDSLYGVRSYQIFDSANSLIRHGGALVEFIALKSPDEFYMANRSGVWSAKIPTE